MQDSQRAQRGFTLIELMIVVAIVGILAAIAYPAYSKYVLRGYRSEGIAMLTDTVARMERFYAQNNTYVATPATLGITNTTSTNSRYQLTIPSTTTTTYTVTVTPINNQLNDTCGAFSIAQDGTKSPDPSTSTCWK